jgi:RND superfamily putative drug exporter
MSRTPNASQLSAARLADLPSALRRPAATLGVTLVVVAALGILGRGVEGSLGPTSLGVPGTESARAGALLRSRFGDSAPFAIVLRGPSVSLDRQGPALVGGLRRATGATIISPWDRSEPGRLRPSPGQALILADLRMPAAQAIRDAVSYLERVLKRRIHSPVTVTQTGFATLSRAIQDESVRSTRIAELVAIPILLIVLLFVFRSPLAAAIPLFFGATTVIAARGVLALAASHVAVDGFALTVCSMMGLALGVDYALLMVSRFREELEAGASPLDAAWRTRQTAGRTTVFAGSTLVLAMAMTLWVMPGNLFLSLAGAAIVVTAISVAMAALVAPPLLMVLGHNIDRWRLSIGGSRERLMAFVGAVLRRPRRTAALLGGVLLLLAAPALGLRTGPPGASELPASNSAREDAETVDRAIGEGWDAPFVMVAAATSGPIASSGRLAALRHAQRKIAADPGVQAVIGPGQIARRVAPLRRDGERLLAGRGEASPARLSRLGDRLDRAAGGVGQLRTGLAQATDGAGLLASGSVRAGEGAARISLGWRGRRQAPAVPSRRWGASIAVRQGWPRPSATPPSDRARYGTN